MKPSIIILLLFLSSSLYSQHRTFYTLEAGLTSAGLLDTGISEISSIRNYYPGTKVGLHLRKEIGKTFSLEAGINRVEINDSFKAGIIGLYTDSDFRFVFPVKLNIGKSLYSDRLFLFSSLGAQYYRSFRGSGGGLKAIPRTNEYIQVEYMSTDGNHFQVIGSLGLRYRLVDEMLLTLSAGYSHGFKTLKNYDITHLIRDIVIETAQAESRGTYWDITLGLSYPLGRGLRLLGSAYNRLM